MAVRITLQKVTVIAERLLRDDMLALLKKHGARGWTLTMVEGEGTRGIHASEWEGRNVQIDTLVSPEIAGAIMEEIGELYFDDWAVIVYSAAVEVMRREKYLD